MLFEESFGPFNARCKCNVDGQGCQTTGVRYQEIDNIQGPEWEGEGETPRCGQGKRRCKPRHTPTGIRRRLHRQTEEVFPELRCLEDDHPPVPADMQDRNTPSRDHGRVDVGEDLGEHLGREALMDWGSGRVFGT